MNLAVLASRFKILGLLLEHTLENFWQESRHRRDGKNFQCAEAKS
jgi:hypothetical protein